MNLLVIDDLALVGGAIAESVSTALNSESKAVTTVKDALNQPSKPNLIVLKMPLPGHDTENTVSRLAATYPHSRIIGISPTLSVPIYRRLRRSGIHGYVSVQDGLAGLIRAARTVLAGQQHISARLADESWEELGDPLDTLTDRERSTLTLYAQGLSMKEIASELEMSVKTAETHRNNFGRKLGHPNRSQVTALALRAGLVHPDALAVKPYFD